MPPETEKIKKKAKKLVDNQGSATLAILDDTENILIDTGEIKDSLKEMCDMMPKEYDDAPIIESLTEIKTLLPKEYDDQRITQAIFNLSEEIKKKDFRGLTGERGLQGLHGKDGLNGRDGETPTDERIIGLLEQLIPEPVLPLSAIEIRDNLESLQGVEMFDAQYINVNSKYIKDLENVGEFTQLDRAIGILDQRTSFLINKVSDLSSRPSSSGGVTSLTSTENTVTITGTSTVNLHVSGALVHPTTGSTFEYSQVPVGLVGQHNTGLGVDAGKALTTGLYNVVISQDALKSAIDATSVIAIGFEAAKSVVTGAANSIVIGTSNASLATTLTTSTIIGTRLATSASGVASVIAVGDLMFQSITSSATSNLGIGFNLFNAITSDASNYGIGKNIADTATSISATYSFGEDLIKNASSASSVFSFGANMFNELAFASNLYGFGSSNMNGSGSGAFDSFIIGSGIANTGAAFLNASILAGVSIASINSDPSIDSCNIIGYGAGASAITLSNENYFGLNAGYNSQHGSGNNLFGGAAGYGIIDGQNNNYFGYQTGYTNDASGNIGFGTTSMYNWSGDNNLFIGGASGYTGIGTEIVGVGYSVFNAVGTLTRSMALGSYAGAVYSTDVTDVVLVGYATEASSTTASNELDFGSASSGLYNVNFGWGGKASTAPAGGIVTLAPTATAGTNLTGSRLAIQAGNGTGTGGSGAIEFYTSPVGTTGTTANTPVKVAEFNKLKQFETFYGRKQAVRVVTAAGAVTVTTDDDIVVVNKGTGAATTVNLPAGVANMVFTIKDGKGDAATNNITVTPAAGNIDGAGTYLINNAYQSATFVYNGTQWNQI